MSLSWSAEGGRRAERLQSAVFARVYRENADDIVLWPKYGLPIQPGPDEDEVILGQVVMTDFARAQVLDRLLVYERRIENSLYRTMAQLRKEREARTAATRPEEVSPVEDCPPAGQECVAPAKLGSFGAGATTKRSLSTPSVAQESPASRHGQTSLSVAPARADRISHILSRSEGALPAGQEPVAPTKLASFGVDAAPEEGANAKITPDGVTTNEEGRATRSPAETLHPSRFTIRRAKRSQFKGSVKCEVSSLKWEESGFERGL